MEEFSKFPFSIVNSNNVTRANRYVLLAIRLRNPLINYTAEKKGNGEEGKEKRDERQEKERKERGREREKKEEAHIPPRLEVVRNEVALDEPPLARKKKEKDVSFRSSDPTFDKHRSTTVFHAGLLPRQQPSTVIPRSFTASNQFSPKRRLAQKSLPIDRSIERRFGWPYTRHR